MGTVEEQCGQPVPPAALQAGIWYPEQELYRAMGATHPPFSRPRMSKMRGPPYRISTTSVTAPSPFLPSLSSRFHLYSRSSLSFSSSYPYSYP